MDKIVNAIGLFNSVLYFYLEAKIYLTYNLPSYCIINLMPRSDSNLQITELAKRIKTARTTARLSQSELALKIGVSDKSISAYEQGRSTPPFEKLRKIASVTNHSLGYFTQESNEEAVIASKLTSIEAELREIRKLLEKKRYND